MDLDFRKIVGEYLMCNIKTDINDFDTCEMQCYSESTADGYDVYVLKYTKDEMCIVENVYYYEHDIAEQIMYSLDENKVDSIYIDEHLYDDCYIEEAFERCEGCCSRRHISLSDAISPCSAPHSSYDRLGDAIPLLLHYSIVVGRRFGGSHHRLQSLCVSDELHKLHCVLGDPFLSVGRRQGGAPREGSAVGRKV